jgi:hypothetical protein
MPIGESACRPNLYRYDDRNIAFDFFSPNIQTPFFIENASVMELAFFAGHIFFKISGFLSLETVAM